MEKPISIRFETYGELAKAIMSLPPEMQDKPVMFGDMRGDNEREAFSVDEIGTVADANYIQHWDDEKVKPGTLMLF